MHTHQRPTAAGPRTASSLTVWLALATATSCTEETPRGAPTFADDVAEIIYSSCAPCHRPGGLTPFSLTSYRAVRKRRDQIVELTSQRRMPPWLPTHGDFVGDRRLSNEDIDVLRRWVDAGAPRGDTANEPPLPEFPKGWQLRQPDLIVTVAEELTCPPSGPEIFRNYVIPVPVDEVKFVEAVEIRPGNRAVHHAVLAVDTTKESRRRDERDREPGFPGMEMGNAKPPDGYFLGWTPGKLTRRSPEGMAWRLTPGADLVLQLHLTPTGRFERLRPRIGLYFTKAPPTAVSYPLTMFSREIDLPPGATDVLVKDHFTSPVPIQVHSIYPHAHYLCRRMAAWAILPGGKKRDLFRIDRWDFDWQDDYQFVEPIALPAGSRIEFEYHYDNSANNKANPSNPPRRVKLGDRSIDEMANLTMQTTVADHRSRLVLGEAGLRRQLEKMGYAPAVLLELAGLLRETGRADEAIQTVQIVRQREPENADALCELGHCLTAKRRTKEAEQAYGECLRLDPTQGIARVQLANILMRSNRAAQAIAQYEAALKQNPGWASVHHNLALAHMARGTLDRAEKHLQKALTLSPGDFHAWYNLGRVLAARNKLPGARAAFRRALALRPGDASTLAALKQLGN